MKKYVSILKRTQLFAGVGDDEIISMLSCLNARLNNFKKGEYVLRQGEHLSDIIVLVEGSLHVQKDDYWGNRSLLNQIDVGEMFGEAYVAPASGGVLNDVIAVNDSTVILFDVRRILTTCPTACRFHAMVVKNMFFAISEKNRQLVQKLGHMSEEAKRSNSPNFTIPFNRQQLADFLSVDRSAMSNELCKMRDEGLIEFEKNQFKLL